MKIILFSMSNQIQSWLRIRCHDNIPRTKVPSQLKTFQIVESSPSKFEVLQQDPENLKYNSHIIS